jgi:2-hydroxycyclohexanecarboxyl-CoA dehydrogenase
MDLGIRGRVVIVTGGGQGIGRATSKLLAEEGALVAVNDIVEERANAVAQEIAQAAGKAIAVVADVTNGESVRAMVRRVEDELGPVSILINNAGNSVGGSLFQDSEQPLWERQIAVTAMSVLHCCRSVLAGMIERRWGRIVNVSSDSGRVGRMELSHYSLSKAGVVGFSKALAREVGQYGITVNCVSPGATETEVAKGWVESNKEWLFPLFPLAPAYEHLGLPIDIANACVFFASDLAAWVTGQVLSVNGGRDMVD